MARLKPIGAMAAFTWNSAFDRPLQARRPGPRYGPDAAPLPRAVGGPAGVATFRSPFDRRHAAILKRSSRPLTLLALYRGAGRWAVRIVTASLPCRRPMSRSVILVTVAATAFA